MCFEQCITRHFHHFQSSNLIVEYHILPYFSFIALGILGVCVGGEGGGEY